MSGKSSAPLLPGVQYLRGYAVLLVVLIHANGMMRYPQYFGASPASLSLVGLFGVAVFFVISGFIITIVCFDRDRRPSVGVAEFFKRRFVRIVPFMWLATIGYTALSALGTAKVDWGLLLRSLVLWPTGEFKPNVLWSLRHELIFYLLFAATMLTGRRLAWVLVAWFLAPLVAAPALALLDPNGTLLSPELRDFVRVVFEGTISGANLQFGAGMLLGWLWLAGGEAFRARIPAGPLVPLAAMLAGAYAVERHLGPGNLLDPVTWTVLSAAIVFLGLLVRPTAGPLHRGAMVLGNASYAIYLIHNPILLVALEAAGRSRLPIDPVAFWWVSSLVAIGGGIVAHYVIEKPLVRALTQRTHATKLPVAAAG